MTNESAIEWKKSANCRRTDPDLFFPAQGQSDEKAKELCRDCRVRHECLQFALTNNEHFGIWGGLSEQQRNKLRKKQRFRRASGG